MAETISEESAITGLHSVTLVVRAPHATVDLMTGVLGFAVVDETEGRIRMAVNGIHPGHLVDIISDEQAAPAKNGIGTVHHVALAIATDAEQLALRADLVRRGLQVTDVRDRQYFKSIYFREPGGVLFEVATTGPGFLIDEDLRNLGRDLKLPPWEEPHRQRSKTDCRRSLTSEVVHPSRFSLLGSCSGSVPVPGSGFPVPGSRFLVRGSWFAVLCSGFAVLCSGFAGSAFGAQIGVAGTEAIWTTGFEKLEQFTRNVLCSPGRDGIRCSAVPRVARLAGVRRLQEGCLPAMP